MTALIEGAKRRIPDEYCYYRSRLSAPARRIYDRICDAMCRLKMEAELDPDCFESFDASIIQGVLYDQPLLYFVSGKNIQVVRSRLGIRVCWSFETDMKTIAEYDRLIMSRIRQIQGNIRKSAVDFVRLVSLHELLQDEHIAARRGTRSWKDYCIIGPLLERETLCEGMAKLFYLLCVISGIRCILVTGEADDQDGQSIRHSWNIAAADGTYMHIDMFWDALLRESGAYYCYDYFGLNDKKMSEDHRWNAAGYPPCTSERFDRFAVGEWIACSDRDYEKLARRAQEERRRSLTVRMLYPFDAQKCAGIAERYLCMRVGGPVYYRVNNHQHILEVFPKATEEQTEQPDNEEKEIYPLRQQPDSI